jgi:hypothetical protein
MPKRSDPPKPSAALQRYAGNQVLRFSTLPYFPRNKPAIEEIAANLIRHCRTPEHVTEAVTYFLGLDEPHMPTASELKGWAYQALVSAPRSEKVKLLREKHSGAPCDTCKGDGQYSASGQMPIRDPETREQKGSRYVEWVAFCKCPVGQALQEARKQL